MPKQLMFFLIAGLLILSSCVSSSIQKPDFEVELDDFSYCKGDIMILKDTLMLNSNHGKYHSITSLPSPFTNGLMFLVGKRNLKFICADILNYESSNELGKDYFLLSALAHRKPIGFFLHNREKYNTIFADQSRSFLKTHSEEELRRQICGKKVVSFQSSVHKGFIFQKENGVCDVYCFFKNYNNCINFMLIDKTRRVEDGSMIFETLKLLENITICKKQ